MFAMAKQALKEGRIDDAYFEFGVGLHVLQDATSPAHAGFQPWSSNESDINIAKHVIKEYKYPGINSNLQQITNQYLNWFEHSNDPLPKENLFNNIKHD